MGKLALVSCSGIVGTGAATTGAYALGAFGEGKGLGDGKEDREVSEPGHVNPEASPTAKLLNADIPSTLEEFKKGDGSPCVKYAFGDFKNMDGAGVAEVTKSDATDFWDKANDSLSQGCLVVNWNKWKSGQSDGKWRGNFRFLWTLSKGDKGFLVYTSATTDFQSKPQDSKFAFEGVAYVLERKEGKKWEIVKQHAAKNEKPFGTGLLKSKNKKFPKQGSAISGFEDTSYFGFVNESDDLLKICSEQECKTESSDKLSKSWIWKEDTEKEHVVGNWTDNLDIWWKGIYEDSVWNMTLTVQDIKGKWEEAK